MGAVRIVLVILLAAMVWPEIDRYRAEWMLAEANARLDRVLRGRVGADDARADANRALAQAQTAASLEPGDPRPPLLQSIALLLLRRGPDAVAVLNQAIAQGERPELTLNLGRARGISGDAGGAQAAFLRTAWASPAAIATLPAAMRTSLLEEVTALEAELHAGRLKEPPPL